MKTITFLKYDTAGKIIRQFRQTFCISQEEMSTVLEIEQGLLASIEADHWPLDVDLASRLGAFLGVHPSLLLFPLGQEAAIKRYQDISTKARQLITRKSMFN